MVIIIAESDVSIHAPREGCDYKTTTGLFKLRVSIHAPREGCDASASARFFSTCVSIHAPREGCDLYKILKTVRFTDVSIHAPREGCDAGDTEIFAIGICFNSRTPGGVRPPSMRWSAEQL